ncbi:hypothetical protein cypCar_00049958 [Cyprinus carpio]|nr:hypothetical protein cypCar_00049958 [Cyprinus carpio]
MEMLKMPFAFMPSTMQSGSVSVLFRKDTTGSFRPQMFSSTL